MKNKTYTYTLLNVIILLSVFIVPCYAQELDLAFGSGTGKMLVPIENDDECNSITLQSDGRIVLGGFSVDGSLNEGYSIVRLNQDGSLDNTYNTTGKKVINFSVGKGGGCTSLKVNSLGNIIAGGTISNSANYPDFGIINTNADGSLNTGFNSTGVDSFSIGGRSGSINSVSIQKTDNKIVLAGLSGNGVYADISLSRLNTDGSFDNSFNTNGMLVIALGSQSEVYSSVIQPDGKILVAGSYNGNFIVIRLNVDGSMDNTFGAGNGRAEIDFGTTGDVAFSIALQKDGKIIVGGKPGAGYFGLARLNANGSIDNTFGSDLNGKVTVNMGGISSLCKAIAVDTFASPNKIVMVGYAAYNGGTKSDFAIARLDLNGIVEAKSTISVGSVGSALATSVAIQPDSKIVVAGYASNGTDNDFAVIRLLPDFITTEVEEAEVALSSGVNVFPNPTSYQLNVHSSYEISNIAIYNTFGEKVFSQENHDRSAVLDISNLSKGIYTAVISTDRGNVVKKVVKQ